MQQSLACSGRGTRFVLAGELVLLGSHPLLSGFFSASDQAGGSFAHCEFRGRGLYITMVSRPHGDNDRQSIKSGGTSHWVLVLNRGDRRLGSVVRRQDARGRSYEALSLTLVKQSSAAPTRPLVAAPLPNAPKSQGFADPPVAR